MQADTWWIHVCGGVINMEQKYVERRLASSSYRCSKEMSLCGGKSHIRTMLVIALLVYLGGK